MATRDNVIAAFNGLVGVSGDDIQAAYGMQGDWCAMTVWYGFKQAGALELLNGGTATAWVPDLWEYYNSRGMTGSNPQPGALVLYDYNGNGTPDHIEYVTSVEDDGTFNCISGNSGRDYVFAENVNMYGVLGFCYPAYGEDAVAEQKTEENKMQFIYRPNGENYLCFFDGTAIHKLSHPDQVTAINMCHQACFGRDIPIFELGSAEAPWATRFAEAVQG